MKRKIIIFFIVTIILLCQINQVNSNTNSLNIINENNINIEDDVDVDIEEIETTIETSNNPEELDLNSRIALIYDRASGNILFEKNGKKQTPMASTTKIMTSIVVLENANLKDTVTIDSKAAGTGGSRLGLKKNDKITVNDLLYGLMLRSGNDAAVALAIHVGGSIDGFAQMMNDKAKEMGLTNSHFVVPHGLDNAEHYTTAFELAKMADYALNIEEFRKIVSTKVTTIYINGYPKSINNTNQLLGSVSGVYGVKTGFTNGAGRCLVSSCKRDDLDIITVVIGADTTKLRTSDTMKLIEYAFNNYEIVNIKEIVERRFEQWQEMNEDRIYVNKGITNRVEVCLSEISVNNMAVKKTEVDKIDIEANTIFYLDAPVIQGQIVGNVKVMLNNKTIEVLKIYIKNEVRKKDIQDYMLEFLAYLE